MEVLKLEFVGFDSFLEEFFSLYSFKKCWIVVMCLAGDRC